MVIVSSIKHIKADLSEKILEARMGTMAKFMSPAGDTPSLGAEGPLHQANALLSGPSREVA